MAITFFFRFLKRRTIMEENKIDQIIASLSRIETSAEGVQREAEREKAEYTQLIEDKIKKFDEELDEKTERELGTRKESLQQKHQEELIAMRAKILDHVSQMDEAYEVNHEQWVEDIVASIIKE
ncbi:MAG: hypothetical protein GX225_01125 [Clostridiales bacterium]|nr:hypothetical protein [Clostridiales bacterium]